MFLDLLVSGMNKMSLILNEAKARKPGLEFSKVLVKVLMLVKIEQFDWLRIWLDPTLWTSVFSEIPAKVPEGLTKAVIVASNSMYCRIPQTSVTSLFCAAVL